MPLRPLAPMLARSARELPRGDDWTYEVKFDGYRTIAVKDGARVTLYSRNLKDVTTIYPSITAAVAAIAEPRFVLDGEIVAVDDEGKPSFQALHHQAAHVTVYYAFDALHANGHDLTRSSLDERRDALARIVGDGRVFRSEPLPGSPEQIEKAVRGLNLEGIVAKRRQSLYESGKRSPSWVKVKFNQRQEFVVGGFKPSGTSSFESLVVGYYKGSKLHFAGRVRAGLTGHDRGEIWRLLAPLRTEACPFVNLPTAKGGHWGEGVTAEDMLKLRWVKPKVVVEVTFVEWTRDDHLRHSEFAGLRTDKRARDVRRAP